MIQLEYRRRFEYATRILPGLLLAGLVAGVAQFIGTQFTLPTMLLALVFGLSLNRVLSMTRAQPGIVFSSKALLRFSVGLLGVRVSYDLILQVGTHYLLVAFAGVVCTIVVGLLLSKVMGLDRSIGILTGGSVAICGASAAVAISAVLPSRKTTEQELAAAVFGVTILSTIAMIVYPLIASQLGFSDIEAGVFFGAAIHDVAQVVGAGLMVSDEAGTVATLVKLFRVSLLAPVVLCISLFLLRFGHQFVATDQKSRLVPGFILIFLCLAGLNTLQFIPPILKDVLTSLSSWGLLIAITAVGMKTSFQGLWSRGSGVLALILVETIFIALFVVFLM